MIMIVIVFVMIVEPMLMWMMMLFGDVVAGESTIKMMGDGLIYDGLWWSMMMMMMMFD